MSSPRQIDAFGPVIIRRLGNWKDSELILLFGFLLVVSIIGFINYSSLISFFVFFFLTVLVCRILFGKDVRRVAGLFVFYSLLALILFMLQYATLPEYKGFSGPLGIGTDDAKFYSEALGGKPVGPGVMFDRTNIHSFSNVLRTVSRIFPYKNVHLLDLLFFNVFGLSFIPVFTSRLAYKLTQERKVSDLAYKFALIGPILMVNGLILVRDGWTAVLFTGAVYFLLGSRYLLMSGFIILLWYIRLASGIQLAVALLIFSYYKFKNYQGYYVEKMLLGMISFAVTAFLIMALLPTVIEFGQRQGLLFAGSFLFRQDFVEGFIAEGVARSNKSSIFYIISSQPFYLRIPFGFLFFLGTPFLSIQNLSYEGIYIPRAFIGLIFVVLFPFYLKYLIQGISYAWKKKEMGIGLTAATLFFLLLALSQLSLQVRHKTMIMPLFYILASYGFYHKTKISSQLGILAAVAVVFMQIVINFLRIT